MPKAWGPTGFCTFKGLKRQPDVVQLLLIEGH